MSYVMMEYMYSIMPLSHAPQARATQDAKIQRARAEIRLEEEAEEVV